MLKVLYSCSHGLETHRIPYLGLVPLRDHKRNVQNFDHWVYQETVKQLWLLKYELIDIQDVSMYHCIKINQFAINFICSITLFLYMSDLKNI